MFFLLYYFLLPLEFLVRIGEMLTHGAFRIRPWGNIATLKKHTWEPCDFHVHLHHKYGASIRKVTISRLQRNLLELWVFWVNLHYRHHLMSCEVKLLRLKEKY
jgi:hypothetical protein